MKKIICLLLVLAAMLALCGCNQTIIDTTYHFDYAYVAMPDGTCVEGNVKSWKDWDDSDVIQVTFTDGTVYYTHSSNVVLIAGD
jgi:major membrane immunogen (membrane-anchored lipoprotein)